MDPFWLIAAALCLTFLAGVGYEHYRNLKDQEKK
tara:strand:- start:1158 stop:1259 length:102 start_codon:yes stop_codon:yes gene_type:complete